MHVRRYLLAAVVCLTFALWPSVQTADASILEKLRQLALPIPAHYVITTGWPEGVDEGIAAAGTDVEAGMIYAPHGLDEFQRAHELAHLLDWQSLSDADHRRFGRLLRVKAAGWWLQLDVAGGMGSAPEWFADTYAVLRTGGFEAGAVQTVSYDTPQYSRRRLLRIGRALERLAQRRGLKTRRPVAVRPDGMEQHADGTGRGSLTL